MPRARWLCGHDRVPVCLRSRPAIAALLIGSGLITAVPLFLFAYGARALPYSTVGVLQYIAPSGQLLCGVLLYHESFGPAMAAGFAVLWIGLLIYALDGWRQTLRDAGAAEPTVLAGDWSASSGYELGGQLAATEPGLTAVFCGNDTMALGVIRALAERGLRVPGDVSVIGFDDVPEAGYYLPPLTIVRQDFGVLGWQALSTLADRMSGAIPAGRRVRVPPELIVRASAASPG